MIRRVADLSPYRSFYESISGDAVFSDPMRSPPEVFERESARLSSDPERRVFAAERDGELCGALLLMLPPEFLSCLCRDEAAYEELFAFLSREYPGYDADLIIRPGNLPLRRVLSARGAVTEPEQQRMVYTHRMPALDMKNIVLLSGEFMDAYCAMHSRDVYWTGERVALAPDRFRTLLALEDGELAGYIDVTVGLDENEPVDLLVRPGSRRRGHGRRLLARALELNEPNGMMLLVDVDNYAAIRLYESLGFEKQEGQNSVTVHLKLREKE